MSESWTWYVWHDNTLIGTVIATTEQEARRAADIKFSTTEFPLVRVERKTRKRKARP